jgi:DNA-3-methyladenine glycosylase II
MERASAWRLALTEALGGRVFVEGEPLRVFPGPRALCEVGAVAGIPEEKLARLRALARAALSGGLDAERLRRTPPEEALARLRALPGVGAWTAQHMLLRGAAVSDVAPTAEPRVLRAFAEFTASRPPSPGEFAKISERWRPYQMWVCFLLMCWLGRSGRWRIGRRSARAGAA